jgi:type I site-specific restriction endonuclease
MKYHNKKTEIDGIVFDSSKEGKIYLDLKLLQQSGEIQKFERQVTFELVPSQKIDGKVVERAITYKADFVVYHNDGSKAVVDAKGMRDQKYPIKRKLMLWVHKIRIQEV